LKKQTVGEGGLGTKKKWVGVHLVKPHNAEQHGGHAGKQGEGNPNTGGGTTMG